VCEAVAYAIDKQQLIDALGYGLWTINGQLAPHVHGHYNPNIPDDPWPYNPDKARELLAEAGYPDGLDTVVYTQDVVYAQEGLIIQQYLEDVGIRSEIKMLDNLAWWQVNFSGWEGLWVTSNSFGPNFAGSLKAQIPPYGFEVSAKIPDGFKEMIDAALAATDPDTQRELNYAIRQALYDEVTVIPIANDCFGEAFVDKLYGADWHWGPESNTYRPDTMWLEE
jgi:ABC-type transport system substrate-binding protein